MFERLQLRKRRPRYSRKCNIVIFQMDKDAVESVGDRRARRAPRLVVGSEHEVIDEKLRAPIKEILQRFAARLGFERVNLVDPDPGQALAELCDLVAAP